MLFKEKEITRLVSNILKLQKSLFNLTASKSLIVTLNLLYCSQQCFSQQPFPMQKQRSHAHCFGFNCSLTSRQMPNKEQHPTTPQRDQTRDQMGLSQASHPSTATYWCANTRRVLRDPTTHREWKHSGRFNTVEYHSLQSDPSSPIQQSW